MKKAQRSQPNIAAWQNAHRLDLTFLGLLEPLRPLQRPATSDRHLQNLVSLSSYLEDQHVHTHHRITFSILAMICTVLLHRFNALVHIRR